MNLEDYTQPIADEYAPRPKASQLAAQKRAQRATLPEPITHPDRDPRQLLLGVAAVLFLLAIVSMGAWQLGHTPPLAVTPAPVRTAQTAPTAAPVPTTAPMPRVAPSALPVPTEAPVAASVAPAEGEPMTGQGMTWVEPQAPIVEEAPPAAEAAPVVEAEKNSRPVDANDWCSGVHLSDPKCQNHDYDRAEKMKVGP